MTKLIILLCFSFGRVAGQGSATFDDILGVSIFCKDSISKCDTFPKEDNCFVNNPRMKKGDTVWDEPLPGVARWETRYDLGLHRIRESVYDTIPVIMLVGDTVMQNAAYSYCGWFARGDTLMIPPNKWASEPEMNAFVWQIRGYEVLRKGNSETEYEQANPGQVHAVFKMNGNAPWDYTEHIAYLDEKKKPLHLFVWQSVNLRP
jgi:hypothetical protein